MFSISESHHLLDKVFFSEAMNLLLLELNRRVVGYFCVSESGCVDVCLMQEENKVNVFVNIIYSLVT